VLGPSGRALRESRHMTPASRQGRRERQGARWRPPPSSRCSNLSKTGRPAVSMCPKLHIASGNPRCGPSWYHVLVAAG